MGYEWQPPAVPGATVAPPAWPQQWGVVPPRKTNTLSIVSLVAGCAQFTFPFVATVVAIVTGHLARSQVKRTGEDGAGMALAGLILGYLGVGLFVLLVGGLLVLGFGFSGDVAQHNARQYAQQFGREIVREAEVNGTSPRDASLLVRAYASERDCCQEVNVRLADGTFFEDATNDDWERVGWRIDSQNTVFGTKHACLTVPESVTDPIVVTDGPCAAAGGTAARPAGRPNGQAPSSSSIASRARTARGIASS